MLAGNLLLIYCRGLQPADKDADKAQDFSPIIF